jgi:hypothetical protein
LFGICTRNAGPGTPLDAGYPGLRTVAAGLCIVIISKRVDENKNNDDLRVC